MLALSRRRGGGRSGVGCGRPGGTALLAVPSPPFSKHSALYCYWNELLRIEPSNTVRASRAMRGHLGFHVFTSSAYATVFTARRMKARSQ